MEGLYRRMLFARKILKELRVQDKRGGQRVLGFAAGHSAEAASAVPTF